MAEFIIDGSHFEAVEKAQYHMSTGNYKTHAVELLCDDESEEYTLRLRLGEGEYETITKFEY